MTALEMTALALGVWLLPAAVLAVVIVWKSKAYDDWSLSADQPSLRWHLAHYDALDEAFAGRPEAESVRAPALPVAYAGTDRQAFSSYDLLIVPGPCIRYLGHPSDGVWGHIPLHVSTRAGSTTAGAWTVYLN